MLECAQSMPGLFTYARRSADSAETWNIRVKCNQQLCLSVSPAGCEGGLAGDEEGPALEGPACPSSSIGSAPAAPANPPHLSCSALHSDCRMVHMHGMHALSVLLRA